MMTPENMIWIAMALPLVAMGLIFLIGEKSPNIREACTIGVSIALFGVVCNLGSFVFDGGRPTWSVGDMMPGF